MLKTTQDYPTSSSVTAQLGWTWAHMFVLLQFTFQIMLLFPQFGVLRGPMRIASFALSLFLLVKLRGEGSKHPATSSAICVLLILLMSFSLHPSINTLAAGAAQFGIHAAVLGPLFWASRLKITPKGFQTLIFMLWGFHTLSAIVGVLQMYFPGQFQPFISTAIQNNQWGGQNLLITLANGQQVYRPMGLTDVPGGAANAGFYALLLSVGIALKEKNKVLRIACLGSAAVGLFCIYLSQVRSRLVFAAISLLAFAVVLAKKGDIKRLTAMIGGVTSLFVGTFTWAVSVGGPKTLNRIFSLFSDRPDEIYHENRGKFLQYTLEYLLPQYPLGAGLGRWGTILDYFGDVNNPYSEPIWVEIQMTGWLLDGGVPMIVAYVAAIYLACSAAWQIALSRRLGEFALWGALIFAYNIGAVAFTFNYPLFNSQGGIEFWLLNTALFVGAHNSGMPDNKSAIRRRL